MSKQHSYITHSVARFSSEFKVFMCAAANVAWRQREEQGTEVGFRATWLRWHHHLRHFIVSYTLYTLVYLSFVIPEAMLVQENAGKHFLTHFVENKNSEQGK